VAALFRSFDKGGSGVITRAEFEAALASTKPCAICAVDVKKTDYGDHYNECRARVFRERAAALAPAVSAEVAALFEPSSHLGGVVLVDRSTENAVLVAPRLFLGNQWAATGDAFLVPNRVRGIVNCAAREAATLPPERRAELGVLEVRLEDILDIDDVDYSALIVRASDHVKELLAAHADGAVLVHCVQGVSRSATVVTAFLVRHAGMSLLDAAALVRRARWQAMPNRAFWRALRNIELDARGGASSVPAEAVEQLHWSSIAEQKGRALAPLRPAATA
jgi:dual specificity phosphatase 12